MARREFASAHTLLPKLLAKLAKEGGHAGGLRPVWAEAVGEVSARHSRPLFLEGTTLVVEVESPRWEAALRAGEKTVLARLGAAVGEGTLTALRFRTVEKK